MEKGPPPTLCFEIDVERERTFIGHGTNDTPPDENEKTKILKLLREVTAFFAQRPDKVQPVKQTGLLKILRKLCASPDAKEELKVYAGRETEMYNIILKYRHDPDCKDYISSFVDGPPEKQRLLLHSMSEDNPTPQTETVRSGLDSDPGEAATCGDKLVIVMVGLPARGKTYISRRLMRYLRFFHGVRAQIFNVGNYRRHLCGADVSHNFFSNSNSQALNMRQQCAQLAMNDLKNFLVESNTRGTVGVFDATNTTKKRRNWIITQLLPVVESKSHVVFVESVCQDEDLITSNILQVKSDSPDYVGKDKSEVVADFRKRIAHYQNVYQPIMDDSLSYVRLVDAGRQVTMNNIKGYLPSKITQFLMCLHTVPRPIFITLNGASVYDEAGKIGGDSGLSAEGKRYAKALAGFVQTHVLDPSLVDPKVKYSADATTAAPAATPPKAANKVAKTPRVSRVDVLYDPRHTRLWMSGLKRCTETVQHIPHPKLPGDGWIQMRPKVWRALNQQYTGIFDGMNLVEIAAAAPEELTQLRLRPLTYRYPRGESMLDILTRLDPVIHEIERARDPILIVAHRSVLALLYCYLTDQPRDKAPHIKIPRNHVIKLQPAAYSCVEEVFDVMKVVSSNLTPGRPTSRSFHHPPIYRASRSTSFHTSLMSVPAAASASDWNPQQLE